MQYQVEIFANYLYVYFFINKINMKRITLTLLFIFKNIILLAQTQPLDSLFTADGLFLVDVTEITADAVKYKFHNEGLLKTIPKNTVLRIRLNTGENLTFFSIYNPISGVNQWPKVNVVYTKSDVKGLVKLTELKPNKINSKFFSSASKNRLKGIDLLKMQTAMLGGNIVYLNSQQTKLNDDMLIGLPKNAIVYGIVYSSRRIEINDYKKYYGDKLDFILTKKEEFNFTNQTEIKDMSFPSQIVYLENFQENSDGLYVNTKIPKLAKSEAYKVTYLDSDKVIIMWKDKSRIINYTLSKLP
jgi:hypothetical protein